MTDYILARCEPKIALSHLALYGLGAILEDRGYDIRLSWTHQPRPRVELGSADTKAVALTVRQHAARHTTRESWVMRDIDLKGEKRGLMSPRLSAFGDQDTWERVQAERHDVLDALTRSRAALDLRMIAALGEPAYWSRNQKGNCLQDDGASRWEMQPRNRGSEFVQTRLRKLAAMVAARDPASITAGLSGAQDLTDADLTSAVGLAASSRADSALVWCALWGISQLPIAPRVSSGTRPGTAATTGHIGRSRREWFYTPVWYQPWRPARLRSVLASAHVLTVASGGLRVDEESRSALVDEAARRWLSARGIVGLLRFPIQRFGSDNAPERRAMRGEAVAIGR